MREFQVCTRCVMDTTDSQITFNEDGVCDHCISFDQSIKPNWPSGEDAKNKIRIFS